MTPQATRSVKPMRMIGLPGTPMPRALKRLALDVKLVEQRWIADRRLRIAHQHRRTGRGAPAAHDPGMAELRSGWAVTAAAASPCSRA